MNNRITVTALKVLDSLSHETLCYTCNVLWDGKKIGVAENTGNGGMTLVICTGDQAAFQQASNFAAAQPMLKSDGTQDVDHKGQPEFYTLEDLVDEIAYEAHNRKKITAQLKRNWSKNTDFLVGTDHRVLKAPYSPKAKEWILGKYPGAVILNELTFELAVERVIAFNKELEAADQAHWEKELSNGG